MIVRSILDLLSTQLFGNILVLVAAITAFIIGYRQIALNDTVELYPISDVRKIVNIDTKAETLVPIIKVQNIGTRLVYLDKYIFNGSEYLTHGQVLPSSYANENVLYWIDLPRNGQNHVSLTLYYHDLDSRYWKTDVIADFVDGSWRMYSLPRVVQ